MYYVTGEQLFLLDKSEHPLFLDWRPPGRSLANNLQNSLSLTLFLHLESSRVFRHLKGKINGHSKLLPPQGLFHYFLGP